MENNWTTALTKPSVSAVLTEQVDNRVVTLGELARQLPTPHLGDLIRLIERIQDSNPKNTADLTRHVDQENLRWYHEQIVTSALGKIPAFLAEP